MKTISLRNLEINKTDLFELLTSIQNNNSNEVNEELEKLIKNNLT